MTNVIDFERACMAYERSALLGYSTTTQNAYATPDLPRIHYAQVESNIYFDGETMGRHCAGILAAQVYLSNKILNR